jgi:hypothetical protein
MFRIGLALLAVFLIAGCESSGGKPAAQSGPVGPTDTERAAYAASVHFPGSAQPRTDVPVMALTNPSNNSIRVYNFSDRPMRNADVWVNQAFVSHLEGIPARGGVMLHTTDFYNALGSSLASQTQPFRQIQIRTPEGIYNVWGPLSE